MHERPRDRSQDGSIACIACGDVRAVQDYLRWRTRGPKKPLHPPGVISIIPGSSTAPVAPRCRRSSESAPTAAVKRSPHAPASAEQTARTRRTCVGRVYGVRRPRGTNGPAEMRPPSLRGHLTSRAPLRYGLVPRDPLRPPATRPSPSPPSPSGDGWCPSELLRNDCGAPAHGDTVRESFESIYTHWHPQLLRWARHRCVDPQEAEDVAQQVFADLWRYSGSTALAEGRSAPGSTASRCTRPPTRLPPSPAGTRGYAV
ncbi:sigma factor [Streptomyces rubiginosohelvolus]|uniref:RNA polymerase sigma factor n=1 Tax=Streptomyces rubiginosohelvolus TaxID=67362 RepID=UPI00340B5A2F